MVQDPPQLVPVGLDEEFFRPRSTTPSLKPEAQFPTVLPARSSGVQVSRCSLEALDVCNGFADQWHEVHGAAFQQEGARLQLRHLQEVLDHDRQAITGLIDGEEELLPLGTGEALITAQQRCRVRLDGCQGAAQFMAHRGQQFRNECRRSRRKGGPLLLMLYFHFIPRCVWWICPMWACNMIAYHCIV